MTNGYRGTLLGLLIAGLLMLPSQPLSAQRIVDVHAGYGTINEILSKDSAASFNTFTMYRLHNGVDSIYITQGTIYITHPIGFMTSGTGPRAQIWLGAPSDGSTPVFSASANLTLKGLYLTGVDELGTKNKYIVRLRANGIRLIADSCHFDGTTSSALRSDNSFTKLYVKNSTISNLGGSWSEGRGVDNRNIIIDTLVFENCTFYRLSARTYRDGGGTLNYAKYNHCTFVDLGAGIGQFVKTKRLIFENNLAINCGFTGYTGTSTGALLTMDTVYVNTVSVENNNFWADTALIRPVQGDSVKFWPWYNAALDSILRLNGDINRNNICSPVTFTKAPTSMRLDSLIDWYWENADVNSQNAAPVWVTGTYNFAYGTGSPSYTGGIQGRPLGSELWFGQGEPGPTSDIVGGVTEYSPVVPGRFDLGQNYPNPFNPSTAITVNLPLSGHATLKVYTLLGREVATLMDGPQAAGTYTVTFDAGTLASGIYFYRLQADAYTATKKMLLTK